MLSVSRILLCCVTWIAGVVHHVTHDIFYIISRQIARGYCKGYDLFIHKKKIRNFLKKQSPARHRRAGRGGRRLPFRIQIIMERCGVLQPFRITDPIGDAHSRRGATRSAQRARPATEDFGISVARWMLYRRCRACKYQVPVSFCRHSGQGCPLRNISYCVPFFREKGTSTM